MTQEIFKDVKDYEGLYQVSNLGRVKSLNYSHTHKEKILKPATNRYGYLYVSLCKNGKPKKFQVHRLVAQSFIPNPNNYPCINHKNEVKTNNNVDNLEWCTYRYNLNYGTHNKRMAKTKTRVYNTKASKIVLQYDKQGNFIKEFPSAHEVQRQLGYPNSNVSRCCRGGYKSAYGYIWKYKEN